MGSALGAALAGAGRVVWCSQGRSQATFERAARAGLEEISTLGELLAEANLLLSVCPPHAAEEVARSVAAGGYSGIYADLNAISPARAERIAATVTDAGAQAVDGGIIGNPPTRPGMTRIFLSGASAAEVVTPFQGGPVEVVVLAGGIGQASALKMAYASLSKGSAALGAISRAIAAQYGVELSLLAEWQRGPLLAQPGGDASIARTAAVAWRWLAEMHEIAETAEAAGLPGQMHRGAAELFSRWESRRDQAAVRVDELLQELVRPPQESFPAALRPPPSAGAE
jgi:3-hydroxyisobutyrate dehydrogenase-like beta-hydroxyacid dehydrogenase